MKTKLLLFTLFIFITEFAKAQNNISPLPSSIFIPGNGKQLIIFFSGDGGLNSFSTKLAKAINNLDYDVILLDSKKYFNSKYSINETTTIINRAIQTQFPKGIRISFLGYSFGADVVPFIFDNLNENTRKQTTRLILLSPSETTDLQVHWADMMGLNVKRPFDVANKILRLSGVKILVIADKEELPNTFKTIRKDLFSLAYLDGGHKFDENQNQLLQLIHAFINKQ